MKYPFDYGDEGELSAYEYSAFMDAMARENRELFKSKGSKSSIYSEADEEDGYNEDSDEDSDDMGYEEEWEL